MKTNEDSSFLNVLFVIPTLGHGGAQKVVVELCRNMLAQSKLDASEHSVGQEPAVVHMLTFADGGAVPYFYHPPADVEVESTRTYVKKSPSYIRLAVLPLQIRRAIKKHEIDVVVSFQDIANFPVIVASSFSKVKVIVSERQDTRFYNFSLLRKYLRAWLYPKADVVVVQTKLVQDQMPHSANVVVIPNACPQFISTAKPEFPYENQFRAVTVGRLESQKNLEFLIRASVIIFASCEEWILEIYGSGSLNSKLQELINENHLQNHVFIRGPVTDVEKILVNSNIFLFPSSYEGFPNALAEAISAGLPAIAFSDVSGAPELIVPGENGLLPPRNDKAQSEFSDSVISLMKDHERRTCMGAHSKKIALKYQPQDVYGMWKDLMVLSFAD